MTEQPVNPELTQDDKLWALLCWLFWPVGVIMLLMEDKKTRPFIKYNAVLSLALWVVITIVGAITVGCLYAVGLIYAIVLAVQSFQGNWVTVPVLTDFVKKQGWA
ncbi:MAG: hypothetical protein JXB85_07880 [Anaerolineales bacterium]|nr:hypothetical protein [Anaerolineales bacterium]